MKTGGTKGGSDITDKARFEEIIAGGHHAGNALLPEFALLYEWCKELEERAERLARENRQYRTQLVEATRSIDLASRIDAMTGLANRRDIMEKIEREGSRSFRHDHSFTVLLIDIDDFRRVNDTYGFNAGDDVLVEVARVLTACIRNEDICARWGGEQFLILLPETVTEGSLVVARKVLDAVSMTEFKAQKPGIRITVSIGVCEHDPVQTVYECISRADQALRDAKLSGKNRYVIAE